MDIGNQVSKDQLRQLLDMTPNTPENDNTRRALVDLITAANIVAMTYTYTANFYTAGAASNLLHGATPTTLLLTIQADADFLIINQTFDANIANAARTTGADPVPNINVLLTDSSTSMNMMDSAVPVANIFGDGFQPFILPSPKLLRANSNFQIQAQNYDAAIDYNLFLSFNGVKLFKYN